MHEYMKKVICCLAVVGWLLIGGQAFAQDSEDTIESNWYVGIGWGAAKIDNSISSMTGSTTLNEDDGGYKFFAGYRFNEFFGVEAFYADFGESEIRANTGDTFFSEMTIWTVLVDDVEIQDEMRSAGLGVVLSWPLSLVSNQPILKRITPYLKGGIHFWKSEMNFTVGGVDQQIEDHDDYGAYIGAGVNIDLYKNLAFRAEYEHYDTDQTDGAASCFVDNVDFISGSMVFNF